MSKRQAELNEEVSKSTKQTSEDVAGSKREDDDEMGEFEDPYGDEFESEDEIFEAGGSEDEEMEEDGDGEEKALKQIKEDEELEKDEEPKKTNQQRIFLPHLSEPLGPNETMEPDLTTYDMLHSFNVKWPCLSFDILEDHLGNERQKYPHTTFLVTGTQAQKAKDNEITLMKLSSLSKTLIKDDDDEGDEDDDNVEDDPTLESASLPTPHTTNRIRVNPHSAKTGEYLTASMSESGDVYIWNLTPHYNSLNNPGSKIEKKQNRPIHTISNHGNVEGYGIDWSPTVQTGALLTGDTVGRVFLTKRTQSGWSTDKTPFTCDEAASVEDIQWSPSENTVFSTAEADGFIRIWDTRSKKHQPTLSMQASKSDVNVISWNPVNSTLLASGHDDGTWGVWDLRYFKPGASPVASFDFHKKPITSIEFHPQDSSVVAAASEDNTITLWDLSVEADDEEMRAQKKEAGGALDEIPPQLLFVHWQKDAKEVHWNKQIPNHLASTGGEGFSLWKTISI
ncbi:hypothetical protein TRICI_006180 [Trichomonascus ciferrii]|uniref:Histone-binding protein RBBP4-like N-terminal domain-containing protein n=1 Tax=Trichomonascus ciferrii TaxID=44093 RepID=A0A642UKF0_9ASCO|nr:hypothetical protein TRICI_006180 [Trichomonascus ciferrii]